MIYKGKAKIEDGQVTCASQLCVECEFKDIFKCVDVFIVDDLKSLGQAMLLKREEIKRGEL